MSLAETSLAANFDHMDAARSGELLALGRKLRTEEPIGYSKAHGGFWVVSRYDDVMRIAKDHDTFISGKGITIPHLGQPIPAIPTESDGTAHNRYRSLLSPFLTPLAIRQFEPMMRGIVDGLIDNFIEKGEADATMDFAWQVPVLAMARVFGMSDEDGQRFFEDFTAVAEAVGDPDAHMMAIGRFVAFLQARIDERRANPGEDVISAIVNTEFDGQRLTNEECLGMLWVTTGAATETTGHAIAFTMHLIDRHPEVREMLLEDPSRIPVVIEEALRLEPPNYLICRTVEKEVEIDGVVMKPGDRVMLMWGFANRDEDTFEHADEFIWDRLPNPHVTFGYGIHRCVGMHLARQEIRVSIEHVLKRIPDFTETADPGVPRLRGGLFWGFEHMPIRFAPGQRLGS